MRIARKHRAPKFRPLKKWQLDILAEAPREKVPPKKQAASVA